MHEIEQGVFLLERRIGGLLLIACQSLARLFIGITSLFQQMIIELATFFKLAFQGFRLFLGWINAILEHLKHSIILGLRRSVVKLPVSHRPIKLLR